MKMLTVFILVCAMVALARGDAENGLFKRSSHCPTDSITFRGRCFFYVSAKMTWGDAEKFCLTNRAHLASVHSAEEYYSIQRMIKNLTQGLGRTWLGGSDCQNEGVWLWSDGTPFDYRHKGKFDNRWWRQHCLQMNYGEQNLWDDVQCSSKLPFVCGRLYKWCN
uniref:C-type lectin domain-containing protein n=1 Tax=Amphilophus citrinellus TaxID=61819 RepID=A0A3Q0R3L6_AMPCI